MTWPLTTSTTLGEARAALPMQFDNGLGWNETASLQVEDELVASHPAYAQMVQNVTNLRFNALRSIRQTVESVLRQQPHDMLARHLRQQRRFDVRVEVIAAVLVALPKSQGKTPWIKYIAMVPCKRREQSACSTIVTTYAHSAYQSSCERPLTRTTVIFGYSSRTCE